MLEAERSQFTPTRVATLQQCRWCFKLNSWTLTLQPLLNTVNTCFAPRVTWLVNFIQVIIWTVLFTTGLRVWTTSRKLLVNRGLSDKKTKPNTYRSTFINNFIQAKMRYLTNNKLYIKVILQIAAHTRFWC